MYLAVILFSLMLIIGYYEMSCINFLYNNVNFNKKQSKKLNFLLYTRSESKNIDMMEKGSENILLKEIKSLKEGVYLIRDLKPANNEKREIHGHSVIYIKNDNEKINLFYDPNIGVINLDDFEDNGAQFLCDTIKSYTKEFQISQVTFYRVVSSRLYSFMGKILKIMNLLRVPVNRLLA